MTTFLYVRVSGIEQTSEHQAALARSAGFAIRDKDVITDHGVSGVSTAFADRAGGKRLLDKVRHGDVVVVRWVDRLGRNYEDVTNTIRTLMAEGVIIRTVINNMTFDGTTADPMQKAIRDTLVSIMAGTAQAQAEATKIAQKAGIQHAKASADADRKYRGKKPNYSRNTFEAVKADLLTRSNLSAIGTDHGITRQAVMAMRDRPEEVEAVLARWGM